MVVIVDSNGGGCDRCATSLTLWVCGGYGRLQQWLWGLMGFGGCGFNEFCWWLLIMAWWSRLWLVVVVALVVVGDGFSFGWLWLMDCSRFWLVVVLDLGLVVA